MLIGWLAKLLLNWGVKDKFARPAAWVVTIISAILIAWGGWAMLKSRIINNHEIKRELGQSQADRKADQKVDTMRRKDDARERQEREQLEGSTAGATSDIDRRLAFHECLRLQQAARRDGRKPPTCSRPPVPGRTAGTDPRANPVGS